MKQITIVSIIDKYRQNKTKKSHINSNHVTIYKIYFNT